MRSNVEKQVATTEQNPVDLNLGQRDLTCSHHRPPLSPWKLPQYQQLHALPILSPCPISFLWGQGLPGLLVPKHRPASTLRHQNIWSPPVGPPVTVRGLLQPQAPPDFPSLLPSFHIVENTYVLYSGDQSLLPVSCGAGGHGVILAGPQFPLGAVAGLD